MKDVNSRQVIAHIDEAQNWLDKAKDEYTELNALQGDLHLNLAQAEVRYAWELSYRGNVLSRKVRNPKHESPGGKAWNYYLLPVAAVLLVAVLGGGIALYRMGAAGPEGISGQVADGRTDETNFVPTVQSKQVLSGKTEVAGNGITPVERKREEALPVQGQAGFDGSPALADASDDFMDPSSPSLKATDGNVLVKSQSGGGKIAVSNIMSENERRKSSNPGRNQPVSVAGLTFDEEALTREATQSLRLGK